MKLRRKVVLLSVEMCLLTTDFSGTRGGTGFTISQAIWRRADLVSLTVSVRLRQLRHSEGRACCLGRLGLQEMEE